MGNKALSAYAASDMGQHGQRDVTIDAIRLLVAEELPKLVEQLDTGVAMDEMIAILSAVARSG